MWHTFALIGTIVKLLPDFGGVLVGLKVIQDTGQCFRKMKETVPTHPPSKRSMN